MLTNKLTNDKDYGQLRSRIFHVVVVDEKWVNGVRLSDKAARGPLFIKATLQVSALLSDFPSKKEKKKKGFVSEIKEIKKKQWFGTFRGG